jgi:hypothetical protein
MPSFETTVIIFETTTLLIIIIIIYRAYSSSGVSGEGEEPETHQFRRVDDHGEEGAERRLLVRGELDRVLRF